MASAMRSGLAWAAIGLGWASTAAMGQHVIERDTKLTGPRGRTIERDIRVERGPGYIDRKIEIKRPNETLIRDTRVMTGPGGRPWGPPPGPRFHGGPTIVENVIVERPPLFGGFIGAPFFNLFVGSPPPPPPVLIYPEPIYAPPPLVAYPQPVVVAPPLQIQPAPRPVFDPFADAYGRLKSHHGNSRRDGALTLGRLGDDRAVPGLIDRLEHDNDKEVRVAAAWALGEIGDERAALALERASLYDKKHEVRDAAQIGYRKLPRPGQTPDPSTGEVAGPSPVGAQGPAIRSRPREVLDPGPNPSGPSQPNPDDTPPPAPVPANGPELEAPTSPGPFRNPS